MVWLREFKWLVSKKNRWGGCCVLHFRLAHWCSQGWHKYLGFPIFYIIIYLGILLVLTYMKKLKSDISSILFIV